jgi:YD repeat-containing protein
VETEAPGRVVDSAPEGDAFVANDRVFVTKPDGRRVGFTFVPVPSGGISFLAMWKSYFKPDPGVTDSLEAFGASDYLLESGGQFFDFDVAFNPSTYVLTTRERIRYTIDEVKGLQEVRDPSGNAVSFSDTAITHSNGFSVAVTKDAAKRITKIVDGNGKAISYGYDVSGNLTSVTDQLSRVTRYGYDSAHRFTSITDPSNVTVMTNRYDASGRLYEQLDAAGQVTGVVVDIAGRTETIRDRRGYQTTYWYDTSGNATRKRDALGGVTDYSMIRTSM